jgi:hypothetical protein
MTRPSMRRAKDSFLRKIFLLASAKARTRIDAHSKKFCYFYIFPLKSTVAFENSQVSRNLLTDIVERKKKRSTYSINYIITFAGTWLKHVHFLCLVAPERGVPSSDNQYCN